MILIKSDHNRRIDIAGVQATVRRPVDIDQAITGFTKLRTLRVYRFDQGSVINGYAEEDEVFIVVMAGSIELTIIADPSDDLSSPAILSAPSGSEGVVCAAYLPLHAAYKLVALSESEVAYARASSVGTRRAEVFSSPAQAGASDIVLLLEETRYAERLRFRLVHFDAQRRDLVFAPIHESEAMCESLVYLSTATPAAKDIASLYGNNETPIWLDSSDVVAAEPGERLTLHIARGSSGLVLIVMAK